MATIQKPATPMPGTRSAPRPAAKSAVANSKALQRTSGGTVLGRDSVDDFDALSIQPDEYPTLLYELNENALNQVYGESYDRASTLLLKAAFILSKLDAQHSRQNAGIVLMTYHNLALCYQKLGLLEECEHSLRICLKQIPALVALRPSSENRMKHIKYLGKLHMQYCAVLSQQSRHGDALDHAKYGAKFLHQAILEVNKLVEGYVLAPFPENTAMEVGEGLSLLEGTARKLLPIVKELCGRMATEGSRARPGQGRGNAKINMRHMFGFMGCNDFILGLNIGNIMQLGPLSLIDIYSDCEKQLELTRESLLEKVALLAVSYFCLSTEKRFLAQEMGATGTKAAKESEFWHAKALEIACCFLPGECPLVSHIFMSYQKHHSPIQRVIPEDSEIQEGIELIKPLTGASQLPFQAIIHALNAPDQVFCLTPPGDKSFDIPGLLSSPSTSRPNATSLSGTKLMGSAAGMSMMHASPVVKPGGHNNRTRLNKSALGRKPIIRIHNRQQLSLHMVDPPNMSLIANVSIGEESLILPKRPKSSQGGPISSTLKAKAAKSKILAMGKGGRRKTGSHTENISLLKVDNDGEELNRSFQKYSSLEKAVPFAGELFIRSTNAKHAATKFPRPLGKKHVGKDSDELLSQAIKSRFPGREREHQPLGDANQHSADE